MSCGIMKFWGQPWAFLRRIPCSPGRPIRPSWPGWGRADRGQGLFAPVPGERDGLITNEPGVVLTVFSADCTPVLLHDPVHRAVGAVHAGWRGTAGGIAAKAVEAMTSAFGTRPEDIQAAIGPCIGPCCFETGEDVPAAMVKALGEEALPAIAGMVQSIM